MDIETKYFHVSIGSIISEFGGTAVLLMIGCLGCSPNPIPYQASVSFGMALITSLQLFGHISGGHFNPAVTIASVIFNKLTAPVAIIYVLAQLLGATAGYSLALFFAPTHYGAHESGTTFCNTIPTVGEFDAFMVEFIYTMLLILFCCSVWDDRNEGNRDSFPIKLGLFLFVTVMVAGPLTGGSLNPARTFGPSVVNNNWAMHWVYWVAPILGGVVGAVCYRFFLLAQMSPIELLTA